MKQCRLQRHLVSSLTLLFRVHDSLYGNFHDFVFHTSWMAIVTSTNCPKSVRNSGVIELFYGVVCFVTLPFWHFCWCRGFCHGTESDLFLFLFVYCDWITDRQVIMYINLPNIINKSHFEKIIASSWTNSVYICISSSADTYSTFTPFCILRSGTSSAMDARFTMTNFIIIGTNVW